MTTRIAILGDYCKGSLTHDATNQAFNIVFQDCGIDAEYHWVGQAEQRDFSLDGYHGCLVATGAPPADMNLMLRIVKQARIERIPLLGTCGGFQAVALEFARNVLGLSNATHEELDPEAECLFITKLSCSLKGLVMNVELFEGTLAQSLYGRTTTEENYFCSLGINPLFEKRLSSSELVISGVDRDGLIRCIEVKNHPFYLATLFVPQVACLPGSPHPVIKGFVDACIANQ
jgi:CTP synthase (UTP-ammonia lyase)